MIFFSNTKNITVYEKKTLSNNDIETLDDNIMYKYQNLGDKL